MGWGSGTMIFDEVARVVIREIPRESVKPVFTKIIKAFEDADWDCQCDSDFIDHSIIGKLLNGD